MIELGYCLPRLRLRESGELMRQAEDLRALIARERRAVDTGSENVAQPRLGVSRGASPGSDCFRADHDSARVSVARFGLIGASTPFS
ncbi:MAG: hypothetical protein ACJ8FS_16980 [Sphingomicrobium sp.]